MESVSARFMLDPSFWPRQGYDIGNRSQVPTFGPTKGKILARFSLLSDTITSSTRIPRSAGIVTLADGSLRVTYGGYAFAYSVGGEHIWTHSLTDLDVEEELDNDAAEDTDPDLEEYEPIDPSIRAWHSPPLALATDEIVIRLDHSYIVLDRNGTVSLHGPLSRGYTSGYAPNVNSAGALLLPSLLGDITIIDANGSRDMGIGFGYDLVPPAVYSDGSLAVSGYAFIGFCRVNIDGQYRWKTTFRDADLPATINREDIAGVGSVNDDETRFFDPTGVQIGSYSQAARLAMYNSSEWIAGAHGYLAKLDLTGQIQWQLALPWLPLTQPIVDRVGNIYSITSNGLAAWDGLGQQLFRIRTGSTRPHDAALVAPGVLACIADGALLLIE